MPHFALAENRVHGPLSSQVGVARLCHCLRVVARMAATKQSQGQYGLDSHHAISPRNDRLTSLTACTK
jgi:hypothetical protein